MADAAGAVAVQGDAPAGLNAIAPTVIVRPGDVLTAFLDTCDSPETRRNYAREIRTALAAFNIESLRIIDGAMLAAWRRHIVETDAAPNSKKAAIVALRAFLRFARVVGACHLTDDVLRIALATPKGAWCAPTPCWTRQRSRA